VVVIHKSWCGACKRLGPSFAADPQVKELAAEFVMINVHDDEEPADDKYKPDGGYVPRIFFFSPEGENIPEYNSGNAQYKYFYSSGSQFAGQMTKALGK
jgi:protein-disulfide reductase (glutathione)